MAGCCCCWILDKFMILKYQTPSRLDSHWEITEEVPLILKDNKWSGPEQWYSYFIWRYFSLFLDNICFLLMLNLWHILHFAGEFQTVPEDQGSPQSLYGKWIRGIGESLEISHLNERSSLCWSCNILVRIWPFPTKCWNSMYYALLFLFLFLFVMISFVPDDTLAYRLATLGRTYAFPKRRSSEALKVYQHCSGGFSLGHAYILLNSCSFLLKMVSEHYAVWHNKVCHSFCVFAI